MGRAAGSIRRFCLARAAVLVGFGIGFLFGGVLGLLTLVGVLALFFSLDRFVRLALLRVLVSLMLVSL